MALAAWLLFFNNSQLKKDLSSLTFEQLKGAPKTNNPLMVLVSELGGKYELGFIILLSRFLLLKEDAFACAVTLCFSILLNQHLKLTYAEPRPFFLKAGPIGTPCDDLEYGNPSGHAIAFTSLVLCFNDGVQRMLTGLKIPEFIRLLVGYALKATIGVVVFSRFYHGVHSID